MRKKHAEGTVSVDFSRQLSRSSQHVGVKGRRVLKFLAENRELVLASSAAELGAKTGTSDATIVRTVQAAGFAGLSGLKQAILASLALPSTPADNLRRTLADLDTSTGAALDEVLQAHSGSLAILASPTCRLQIAAAVHALDASRRIVVFGTGPSAALATYVSTLLARSGRRSRRLNATGSMLADQLLDIRPDDALLILAYGRLYKEVKTVFDIAKELGLPTVLMTEAADNALATKAEVVVAVPRGRPGGVAMHGAIVVALEAIVLSLAVARPDEALTSLNRLNDLRHAISDRRPPNDRPAKRH